MEYTIKITGLNTTGSLNGFTDVVTIVDYEITASDGIYSASDSFKSYLMTPNEGDSFSDYGSLTENQVKEWITRSPMYIVHKSPLEDKVYQLKQTLHTNLPWNE